MADKPEKPAEFTSDEQREAHIEALKVELEGLETSAKGELELGREEVAKRHRARAADVAKELERLGARTPEQPERLGAKQAETRPRGAAKETRA